MKSRLIGSGAIARAYPPDLVAALRNEAGLDPAPLAGPDLRAGAAADCDALFATWGMPALEADEIARYFPALECVFYAAGTVQYFARPFLESGVRVFSAWHANAVPVAETAAAEIILANKGFFQTVHHAQSSAWPEHDCGGPFPGNYNTRVGILGAGAIGTLVIKRLRSHSLNVLVFDPFLSEERADELHVTKVQTPEFKIPTRGLLGYGLFSRMLPTATFLNTGRGRTVNEPDLIAALTEQPTRAAVLDVTDPEPPEAGSKLYTLPNVFLTPHLAGALGNEVQRLGEAMLGEFLLLSQGKPTNYEVTQAMLDTMA